VTVTDISGCLLVLLICYNASYIVRKLGRTGTPLFLLTKGITLSNVSNKGSSSNCLIDKVILDFSLFYFVNAKFLVYSCFKKSIPILQSNRDHWVQFQKYVLNKWRRYSHTKWKWLTSSSAIYNGVRSGPPPKDLLSNIFPVCEYNFLSEIRISMHIMVKAW